MLLKLGLMVLLFVVIAFIAQLTRPETVLLDDQTRTHYGILSLLPAAIAIVLAFVTRQVLLALFLGIATGGVVYAFGAGVTLVTAPGVSTSIEGVGAFVFVALLVGVAMWIRGMRSGAFVTAALAAGATYLLVAAGPPWSILGLIVALLAAGVLGSLAFLRIGWTAAIVIAPASGFGSYLIGYLLPSNPWIAIGGLVTALIFAIIAYLVSRDAPAAAVVGLAAVVGFRLFALGDLTIDFSFPWSNANIVETFFIAQLGTPGFALILFVYLWALGGLIGLWTRTGGALHFAQWVGRRMVVGPRTAKLFTWFLGAVFHQGGTISTLLAGTTARPLLDTHQVSKEESAYMVNSTASPIAVLLPFNAWPITAAFAVAGSIPFFVTMAGEPDIGGAVAFFFQSIPFFFYPIIAVLFTLLLALGVLPAIMGLGRARRRVASTGEIVRPGSEPLQSRELLDVEVEPGYRTGLADFFLPLSYLIVVAVIPFLVRRNLGVEDASPYIAEAFLLALLTAIIVAVIKGMPLKVALAGVVDGAKGVTMAALILAMALTIKGVADALGTGVFLAVSLGDVLLPAIVPALLMLIAMIVAFSTGTSFGTFTVVFPAGIPLAYAVLPDNELFLMLAFGAVISGSVFGDQASPISDSAILSSLATGCDLMDHVTTQIPYAVIAAVLSLMLYLGFGFAFFGT